jgi:hypothetical protein
MSKLKEELWMELAILFFESPQPRSETEIQLVAAKLQADGWSRAHTERVLLEIVAPHAKRNIGYGLPLAIGEEIEFLGKDALIPKMQRSEKLRVAHPWAYSFFLQDWLNKRVLKKVGAEKLLRLL